MFTINQLRLGVLMILLLVVGGMWAYPQYNVWQKGLSGRARLAEAEQSRQIAIEEAKAIKESAQFKADAEVIRARGVAEANSIIADGLGGPDGYLRWLFIEQLAGRNGDTIYIPTEAGLPILEARNK
jgi:regulator of protease activity HflC (stomatin/prohibitin superfamily)